MRLRRRLLWRQRGRARRAAWLGFRRYRKALQLRPDPLVVAVRGKRDGEGGIRSRLKPERARRSIEVQTLLSIAVGGATGAVARYGVSIGVHAMAGRNFPYGTLTVNVLGSFLMGFLYIMFMERLSVGGEWRALLLVGGLGAFTTFSTFSLETLNLLEGGEAAKALLNVVLSIAACLVAAWVGISAGRQL